MPIIVCRIILCVCVLGFSTWSIYDSVTKARKKQDELDKKNRCPDAIDADYN